jgi:hypothetical protein
MFFAANNISKAEANSAEANSFNTWQHLSGSNFLKVFFGIKNIFLIFIFFSTILINSKATSKECLPFVPYGWNEYYVHLPLNSSFCVEDDKIRYNYKTDIYGGRILTNELFNEQVQVFGDSQVVGIDINDIQNHYLSDIYKNLNFIIYAAPNNGPYEVINFLTKNKKILNKKIIVTFNFAVDIHRISTSWHPSNYTALRDYDLDDIVEQPFKYRLIIFKNLLLNKNFTLKRFNNKKMQTYFLNSNQYEISNNLVKYFSELDQFAKLNDLKVDFIITHPYWLYSRNNKKNKLILETKLTDDVYDMICKVFKETENINKILISKPMKNFSLDDLTSDTRHIKSTKIKLFQRKNSCPE